jgi:hypothetical protein
MRCLLALVLALSSAAAQERVSGPEPGRALPPVRVYTAAGAAAGELDVATRLQQDGGALLFVHELTRETAPVTCCRSTAPRDRASWRSTASARSP